MDKKFVCSVDRRSFATKQALDQHRQASHGAPRVNGQKKAKRSNPPPQRAAAVGLGDMAQALVAQPQRVVGESGTDMARVSGTDRLLHVEDVKGSSSGQLLLDFLVMPSGFKRLQKVAGAFQRIVYERLEFQVEPQITSSASGGYVVGFVSDPDDHVVNLDQLTATRGSVTTKWWQASSVRANFPSRMFYTSLGAEMREFSPGRFVLMVDGRSTQSGSLTVFCKWSVRLSGAILEAPPTKETTILNPTWIRNGHQGVWAKVAASVSTDGWSDKVKHILGDGVKAGASYRLQTPVPLVKANDQTFALHHWLYVKDENSVFLSVNGPTDFYEASYTTDNLVIDAGTTVFAAPTKQLSGEREEPSSLGSETMTAGQSELSEGLTKLSSLLQQFVTALKDSSHSSPKLRDRSRSEESFSSMEFPRESTRS